MELRSSYFYRATAFIFALSMSFLSHTDALSLSQAKRNQLQAEFKQISPVAFRLTQSQIPNPVGKDIDAINQILMSSQISTDDISSILTKLSKIKTALLTQGIKNPRVSVPIAPGQMKDQSLNTFLETTFKQFVSDLKLLLETNSPITNAIDNSRLGLIRKNFKPLFFGFYDLYQHAYYKYLETVRMLLHGDLNSDRLELIRDLMELLLSNLSDEDPNTTMMLEINPYQRYNVNLADFKTLIRNFIGDVKTLL